jgi:hypothetical protein
MKINPKKKERLKTALTKNSFTVPEDVRKAAERGLELRRKFNRGGLSIKEASEQGIGSGVARARDLSNGKVSADTVKRMRSYFARHAGDADAKGSDSAGYWGNDSNPSAGWIAWLLWGGTSGKSWVNGLVVE